VKYSLRSSILKHYITRLFVVAVVTASVYSTLLAQVRPLDNSEISVVNKGGMQLETYYGNSCVNLRNWHSVQALFRFGIAKNYELQVNWVGQGTDVLSEFQSETTSVAMKMHLSSDGKYLPALSAIVSSNLTMTPDRNPFNPSVNLPFEKKVGKDWNINGNLRLSLNEQEGDIRNGYTLNLEADLTNWLTTYVGVKGFSDPYDNEIGSNQFIEVGMLFWVYDRIMLYPFYDIGLNDSSSDVFSIGAVFSLGR